MTNKEHKENKFDRLARLILYAIFLFVPIFMVPYADKVYEIPKLYLFRFFTEILFWLIILKWLFFSQKAELRFKREAKTVFLFFLLLLLGDLLATFFSPYRWTSFWGFYHSQNGLFTSLHYSIFFLLVFGKLFFFQGKKLSKIMVWGSLPVIFYGLFQKIGFDFFRYQYKDSNRIHASLGQPNFLAVYLVLLFPITLFVFLKEKENSKRYFYGSVLLLHLAIIFWTGSRGGIIALGAELAALLFFIWQRRKFKLRAFFSRKKIIIAFFLLFSFAFMVGFFSLSSSRWFSSDTVVSRLYLFEGGLKLFMKRPFRGWGLDIGFLELSKFTSAEIIKTELSIPGKSHNFFIDSLYQRGIVVSLVYVLILFYALYYAFSSAQEKLNLEFFYGLSLVGWLFIHLFTFETVLSRLFFWICLAVISRQGVFLSVWGRKRRNKISRKFCFSFLLFSVLIFLCLRLNFNALEANINYKKALQKDFSASIEIFEKIVTLAPWENVYQLSYSGILLNNISYMQPEEQKQNFNKAQKILKKVEKRKDFYYFFYKMKALAFYYNYELTGRREFLEESLLYYQKAERACPICLVRMDAAKSRMKIMEILGKSKGEIQKIESNLQKLFKEYYKK